ncbi:P27 family phage terminase small subunit [Streptomyces gobiensis]|uniref:P27 family phage terminase small subunit n=1 Tax=Streptomyces gobiensis TaxID=2875706 RepID=UPI001E48846F|nr:P27 family phage terminase small subunit [Streptomyces gobiensis]UGY94053.1 P27 family phage terminase small subunit [Streptomyces gobiensis]
MIEEPEWAAEFGTDPQTTADASAVWQRATADRIVKPHEREAFATYALNSARVMDAERQISRDGMVLTGANGVPVKHPAITIINIYSAGIRALQNALGLNSYSAARNAAMVKNSGVEHDTSPATVAALKLVAGLDE